MTLSKETIDRLQKDVEYAEANGYDMDERDWGMQEGHLISYNEAKAILASVKGKEWVVSEESINRVDVSGHKLQLQIARSEAWDACERYIMSYLHKMVNGSCELQPDKNTFLQTIK